jgi:hypothetical protein
MLDQVRALCVMADRTCCRDVSAGKVLRVPRLAVDELRGMMARSD